MSRTLVLNSSNYVVGSGNKFVYRLPNTIKMEAGSTIGLSGISIFNSTFNVEKVRGNNTVFLTWLGTVYTIVFEDGYYSISDLNFRIQQFCILNNLYLTANSGSNVLYYVELAINSVRYSVQLNLYTIPTDAQATALGYSKPTGATWSFPATQSTPLLEFNQAFGNLIGQTFGKYPLTVQTSTQNFLSTQSPQISPVNSYILTCNMLNSKYSIPSNTFFTLPLSAALGNLQVINPSSVVMNHISPQIYSEIVITFYDQNFNALRLNDTEVTITLAIQESLSV